uniref:Uncharacterized protein n=1 Tax=Rhipicephalus zambeziensis TaxID=60191 RepID=A0A224YAS6_9ACAR
MLGSGAHLAVLSATELGANAALHGSLISTKPHFLPAHVRTVHINHTSVEQATAGPFQSLLTTGSFHTAIFSVSYGKIKFHKLFLPVKTDKKFLMCHRFDIDAVSYLL